MPQWVKRLPSNRKKLNLNPQNPRKAECGSMHLEFLRSMQDGGAETQEYLGRLWASNLPHATGNKRQGEVQGQVPRVVLRPPHTRLTNTHECVYTETDRGTHRQEAFQGRQPKDNHVKAEETISSQRERPWETQPCDTLFSDFQPLRLWENDFLVKPLAHGNLRHWLRQTAKSTRGGTFGLGSRRSGSGWPHSNVRVYSLPLSWVHITVSVERFTSCVFCSTKKVHVSRGLSR